MTRIRLVGVDDDLGRGGRVLSVKLDLACENENIAEASPQFSPEFSQLLEVARRCGVRLLGDWGFVENAQHLQNAEYSFSLDDPWFQGTLEQDSYGVALATGFVLAELGIEEGSPEVVATGVLDIDKLCVTNVDERQLNEKAAACLGVGTTLLCPPGQYATNEDSCSLPEPGELHTACMMVGGAPLMQALLHGCQDAATAISLCKLFCEAHARARLFPYNLALLHACFSKLLEDLDTELRASVITKMLSLGACASLTSEFEHLLQFVAACEPQEPDFEASLVERVREVFDYGASVASAEVLGAVAWLFMASRWVFGGERLVDRFSPIGTFFRELLERAQDDEFGKAERFVLHALANYGLRSEGLNRTGIVKDIANMVADEPSGNVVAIYRESEAGTSDEYSSTLDLDRIIYEIDAQPPYELFDFDRAESQAFRGVIKISIQDYDIKILWRDGLGIFPPSIDTLHFIGDLTTAFHGERAKTVTSVVDMSCGTGVLGLIAAKHFPQVDQVHFIDIEPGVREILSANVLANWPQSAIHIPRPEKPSYDIPIVRVDETVSTGTPFFPGDVVEVDQDGRTIRLIFHNASADAVIPHITRELPDEKFSVAIATPPYIPIREPLPVPIWPATAGTGLLKWAVSSAGSFAKEMYLSFGEVAKGQYASAISNAKQRWNVTEKLLAQRVVRFRFPGLVDLFDDDHWGERLRKGPFSRVGDMRVRKDSYEYDIQRIQSWLENYAPGHFRQSVLSDIRSLPPFVHVIRNCHIIYS